MILLGINNNTIKSPRKQKTTYKKADYYTKTDFY